MTQEELVAAQTVERSVQQIARELFVRGRGTLTPEVAFRLAKDFEALARRRFMKLL